LAHAQGIFAGTGIEVTSEGRPYLGATLGSEIFVHDHTTQCVERWVGGMSHLTSFTQTRIYSWFFTKIDIFLHAISGVVELFPPLKWVI